MDMQQFFCLEPGAIVSPDMTGQLWVGLPTLSPEACFCNWSAMSTATPRSSYMVSDSWGTPDRFEDVSLEEEMERAEQNHASDVVGASPPLVSDAAASRLRARLSLPMLSFIINELARTIERAEATQDPVEPFTPGKIFRADVTAFMVDVLNIMPSEEEWSRDFFLWRKHAWEQFFLAVAEIMPILTVAKIEGAPGEIRIKTIEIMTMMTHLPVTECMKNKDVRRFCGYATLSFNSAYEAEMYWQTLHQVCPVYADRARPKNRGLRADMQALSEARAARGADVNPQTFEQQIRHAQFWVRNAEGHFES